MNNTLDFWVTGASNGLGLALVEQLLEGGHRVAASGRDSEALDGLAKRYPQQLLRVPGQLPLLEQAQAAAASILRNWGGLDCLILNAGTCDYLADDLPEAELFEAIVSTNLHASEHCLTSALPLLVKRDAPQVMALLSRYSALQLYSPTRMPSGANSTAQWLREQRQELQILGVGLTLVAPQAMQSPASSAQAIPEQWTPERTADELIRRLPQREPELVLEALTLSNLWPLPR
ncbi:MULTISPECIES: SDR family oxidoreductase [Pseudomonas]|uniref:SDR family NAD(P)-dependent oxidoreductase n=1 Tax=Pseudomonas TaxID=286 RepID=UPI000CE5E75A|nr:MULTISPECIES: SDR family oxidoreductase [Pseudomonas]AVD88580.1 short-chain dehydrogenase [Pseudomonas sp. SWI44]MDT8922709.1 SDR family oxidoreductase [Pseudomonas taiwanensis]QQZ35557.1 SDR family oxidoreductase [Pseudomonas sp. SK2]